MCAHRHDAGGSRSPDYHRHMFAGVAAIPEQHQLRFAGVTQRHACFADAHDIFFRRLRVSVDFTDAYENVVAGISPCCTPEISNAGNNCALFASRTPATPKASALTASGTSPPIAARQPSASQ